MAGPRVPACAIVFIAGAVWVHAAAAAPEIPGAPQDQAMALTGAKIHPIGSAPIATGTVLFDQGRITALGADVTIPADAKAIDASGKHVYPGLFDAYTHVGLVEINSTRSTVDNREIGNVNPNVSAHVAINPDSEIIPVTRSNGVLLALSAPRGSVMAGKSAILQLDGWTWEDLALRTDVALHLSWPRMAPVIDWREQRSAGEQAASRDRRLRLISDSLEKAQAYQQARSSPEHRHPFNSRWEALLPVLQGKLPVIVGANEIQQIQAAVGMSERFGFRMILYGGHDAPHCAKLLRKHDIPVIVDAVYRLPRRRSDPYDHAFTLPERLRRAGIQFCISGGANTANTRNLPYHAAMAAAFGLPDQDAIRAITLSPAEILGVADRVGSLDVGKDATMIVTSGDPLDPQTQVERAFVQGREVDLNDRHKRLWRKYEERYRRLRAR